MATQASGGKLAQAGQSVTLAGRPRFAEAMRGRGIVLADERGRHEIANVRAAPSIGSAWAASTAPFDTVFLTVKSYATAEALAELATAVQAAGSTPPTVVSLQNGVGNEEAIAAAFGGNATIAGVLTTPVSVTGPGEIVVEKPSYNVGLAAWVPGQSQTALASDAGFEEWWVKSALAPPPPNPIPEPTGLVLLGSGLVIAARRLHRRRSEGAGGPDGVAAAEENKVAS